MQRYFATFIPGFQKLIESLMRADFKDMTQFELFESSVLFQTASGYKKIAEKMYFNTVFQVFNTIKFDHNQQNGSIAKAVCRDCALTLDSAFVRSKTMRLMVQKGSKQIHIPGMLSKPIVRELSEKTKLKLNPLKADTEFWVLIRNEGLAVFGARSTQIKAIADFATRQGQLRPKMAYLLNALSDPTQDDVFLDPFAGYGSLPLSRVYHFPYRSVYAIDNNQFLVKDLNNVLRSFRDVTVRFDDALNLSTIKSNSITKIVTDPPWGMFEANDTDYQDFYHTMFEEMLRVTKKGATIIILMANSQIFDNVTALFSTKITIQDRIETLVNGKKATVYRIIVV